MARIKWEDRQYNSYFTMKGVGSRGKTHTDKDLKRRLTILGFRSYWRKLELYRKQLISRLKPGLGVRRGLASGGGEVQGGLTPYPELREEAILTELRIMLDNLRSEVSSDSSAGVKHLLKMIEEIIRLISRVFHPSFQSLTPCFAGSNISSAANPRGPPRPVGEVFCLHPACIFSGNLDQGMSQLWEGHPGPIIGAGNPSHKAWQSGLETSPTASPGPGNRIRTRPRIPEILSKQNPFLSPTDQASHSGSGFNSSLFHNSFLYKACRTSIVAITTGTKVILGLHPPVGLKVARLGACLAGTLTAGSLFFGTVKDAVADPGDSVKNIIISRSDTVTGVVADQSAPYSDSYWLNEKGEIWSGGNGEEYTASGEKILDSLDSNDNWQYLAQGEINGEKHFISFNDTEDKVYIRNASTGAELTSWNYPDSYPIGVAGLDINEDELLVYNQAAPKRIGKFSLAGTHLDDMLLPYPTISSGDGIAINPLDKTIIMNNSNDDYFNVVWFTGTEYDNHETVNYDVGPGGNAVITDISFDSATNQVLIATDDPNAGDIDKIRWFESLETPTPIPTPTIDPTVPTPTPTPIPTPEPNGTGIFRLSSGLWAINGVTRTYFGGSEDTPIYNDFNGDEIKDISIFRENSGLWAVKDLTRTYFGGSEDKPVPADYNGNGTDDVAIYRGNSGLWAVKGISRAYFGNSDDTPVPADYDGDGTKDIAIFRPSSGLWAVRNLTRTYFGGFPAIPVPGDYDGDGTSRIGIFRPASGLWAIKEVSRIYFGGATDEPVPADYDGDLRDDIGIFRDISGLWAIRGITRAYFGAVGDIPVTR